MPLFAPIRPIVWGKVALTPHREPPPRTQCGDCKGGGEINAIRCRNCSGRGWHDATHPPRSSTSETDAY